MRLKVKKVHPDAVVPEYKSLFASGFDLASVKTVTIAPGFTGLVPTGLAFEIDDGYQDVVFGNPPSVKIFIELQIRPRSGLSVTTGLIIGNAPGTIDYDYRGEIYIIVKNVGRFHEIINKGDRIAQGVLNTVIQMPIEVVDELSDTERGTGGLGSTGIGGENG